MRYFTVLAFRKPLFPKIASSRSCHSSSRIHFCKIEDRGSSYASLSSYEAIFLTKTQLMLTKTVLLKQNSAHAYEDSFAKAKL
ncbi:hypothetical protein SAMN04487897_104343 [Paenibacillus sp. yr247]|nr:hypothetical protein SAMN04487897_104343 [Paenibacillus sp. yr247]